jgi:sulfur carrier protein
VRIVLNGVERELERPLTVAELLVTSGFGERRVAVELNGEVVPRSLHAGHGVREGDRVEIVHAIGGG